MLLNIQTASLHSSAPNTQKLEIMYFLFHNQKNVHKKMQNLTSPTQKEAMSKQQTAMPTDEQMPSKIAELMGWTVRNKERIHIHDPVEKMITVVYYEQMQTHRYDKRVFRPMTDRNHSRLAVERCAELGLASRYIDNFAEELELPIFGEDNNDEKACKILILATPAQETRAAWRTLNEAAIRAAKESKPAEQPKPRGFDGAGNDLCANHKPGCWCITCSNRRTGKESQ